MKQKYLPFFSLVLLTLISCGSAGGGNKNITSSQETQATEKPAVIAPSPQIILAATKLKQKIDILGGDMERSADFLLKAANPDEIISWYFSDDIPLPYMRVVIDKHQELTEGTPNFSFYHGQIEVMKKIKATNPAVKFWSTLKTDYDGYGTHNNMPDWVYTGGGYNGGRYDPWAFKAQKWARFLADYLKLMSDNGVAIDILSVSKEWLKVMTPLNENNTIKHLKVLLASSDYAGVAMPDINGPASWGVTTGISFLKEVDEKNYQSNYRSFSAHHYDKPSQTDWAELIAVASAMGKSVYNEESNDAGGGPFYGAEPTMRGVTAIYSAKAKTYQVGLKGELFFELWSRGYAKESRSIYFNSGEAGVRGRGYWMTKAFVRGVYNKHYIDHSKSEQLSEVDVMAFSDDESLTLYVINTSETNDYSNIVLTVEGKTITSNTIGNIFWSEDTAIEGQTSSIHKVDDHSFAIDIKASTLAVYKFSIE